MNAPPMVALAHETEWGGRLLFVYFPEYSTAYALTNHGHHKEGHPERLYAFYSATTMMREGHPASFEDFNLLPWVMLREGASAKTAFEEACLELF